ncbi:MULTISPECIES: hypothetical protein [Burkholderia]|uniref:hypothetical protein n=1 Tax=Burkholderia TaxID=32008 RepID=UPI0011A13DCE|nr:MULTISPECIES: hypothetical protein [Burkholderia]MBU9172289.1 hypothetical protein [Burkholderia gladioli]MBU9177418.1 hypothetical protein [Burkholderia gladioli]MCA8171489.1 hypothetical protein [Burkholderia gladioli]
MHCALAGRSARGDGRDGSRAAARAATAWKNRRRHSGVGGDRPAAATVAAAVLELRNARIALWTDVPRGATVATAGGRRPARRRLGKTGGSVRALAVTRSVAATVAAGDLEPRNACIARWTGGPRGAAAATARGRRPARRRHGKTGGGVWAPPVASPGAATVAAADVELRNACIALWLCGPRGASVATAGGRRPARRRRGKTGGGVRALAVTRSAAATAAVAVLERRNARIAPWLGVPRGAAVAAVRGRQFAGGGSRGEGAGKPVAAFGRWR